MLKRSADNKAFSKDNKVCNKRMKGILFGIPLFLLLCGIGLIVFAGWKLVSQTYFISKIIASSPTSNVEIKKIKINNKTITYPRNGEQLGTIIIPSISLNYPIIEGDDQDNLEKGVGHDASSYIPGQNGDVVLDAHRDTMFRNLGAVKIGDIVTLKTNYGNFNYKVYKTRIVTPEDTTAIINSNKEMLTLYTCYPFSYIGHAPERYIVMTEFVNSTDTSEIKTGESDLIMKVIKLFFCVFISIFMVLDLLVLQASIFTHNRLYNSNYYIERFQNLQLYSFIDGSLSKDLGNIQKECNLPKDMFDNLFNKSLVETEVNNYTANTINYMTYKTSNLQTSNLKTYTDKFNNRLDNFLTASNVKLDASTKVDINNIKTQTDSTIKNEIHIVDFNDLINSASFQKIRSYMYKIYSFQAVFIGIFILLVLVLFFLEIRRVFMFVVWFSSALIASGLTVIILVEAFIHTDILSSLVFNSPKLQLIVSSILKGYLQSMLNLSIYITIAGGILFIGNIILNRVRVSSCEV